MFKLFYRPTNKPILQNFYFRNPDDEDKLKIRSKSGLKGSSSSIVGSMLGSRSSQPYASIANMDDSLYVKFKIIGIGLPKTILINHVYFLM